jgi:RNA polymerase primary sigma factor
MLAEAISHGDCEARTRLIHANLRLVTQIARKFTGRGLVLDDLVGEGNVGLLRAVAKFDPRFGTRFCTYAVYWIKATIRYALINTTSTIRVPANIVARLTRWRRVEQALQQQRGKVPSADDVALVLGLSDEQKMLVANARHALSVAWEGFETVDDDLRRPMKAINRREGAWPTFQDDEQRGILWARIKDLDERESTVIELRYGLDGNEPQTLKEIGCRLGVTGEWVRKLELRAINKLGRGSPCR